MDWLNVQMPLKIENDLDPVECFLNVNRTETTPAQLTPQNSDYTIRSLTRYCLSACPMVRLQEPIGNLFYNGICDLLQLFNGFKICRRLYSAKRKASVICRSSKQSIICSPFLANRASHSSSALR